MALRSKKAAAILLIVLVAIFTTVYLWRDDGLQSPVSTEQHATDKNTAVKSADIDTPKVAQTSIKKTISTYQLPSYDKPFDEVFDELKQASDNGEARATCRLAIELLRCQTILAMDQKEVLNYLSKPLSKGNTANQAVLENMHFEESQMFLACKKMKPDDLSSARYLLEKAAQQKQVDAMVLWASGEWIQSSYGRRSFGYLHDPAFLRWQLSAIPTMNEAMHRGSYGAALELMLAYNSDYAPPFNGLVKDDPKQAYTFSVLVRLLENSNAPFRPRAGLSASDTLASEQNARLIFEKRFNGKIPNKGISTYSYGLRKATSEDCK